MATAAPTKRLDTFDTRVFSEIRKVRPDQNDVTNLINQLIEKQLITTDEASSLNGLFAAIVAQPAAVGVDKVHETAQSLISVNPTSLAGSIAAGVVRSAQVIRSAQGVITPQDLPGGSPASPEADVLYGAFLGGVIGGLLGGPPGVVAGAYLGMIAGAVAGAAERRE